MNRSRKVVGVLTVALLTLSASAHAGKTSKLRDQRDRTLGEAKSAYESGKQYAQSQMYDQAITKFDVAIAKFKEADSLDSQLPAKIQIPTAPELALAFMNKGVCNLQKGETYRPRARTDLEEALKRDNTNPLIWYNVMAVRTLMGDHLSAIDALDKALQFGFRNFDALRTDEDLYELRRLPEWRKTLEKHGVFL